MKPASIVLFGVRGSGKDTVGHEICNQLGHYDAHTESFAAPLKEMAKIAFGFSHDDLYGPSKNRETMYEKFPFSGICLTCGETCMPGNHLPDVSQLIQDRTAFACPKCLILYPRYVTPRLALQTLGTEWGRRLSKNVWIDACFRRMEETLERQKQDRTRRYKLFVVTDGRFISERQRSAELGAQTVLLLRKLEDSATATHASEKELSMIPREDFHYILDNTGSLDQLPGLVRKLLDDLGIPL